MNRGTQRIALSILLGVGLLVALVFAVPHWVHRSVQSALDEHGVLEAIDIRIRRTLAIEIGQLRVKSGPAEIHCTDILARPSLHPAALFGHSPRRLTRVDIQHCTVVATFHSSDVSDALEDEQPDTEHADGLRRHPAHVQIDALYKRLRRHLRVVDALQIHRADLDLTRGTRQVDGQYVDDQQIEGQLRDVRWRDRDGAPHLSANLSLSKDVEAAALAIDLAFEDNDSALTIASETPVRIKGRQISFERIEFLNAHELRIPILTVTVPTRWVQRVVLHHIDVRLDATPRLDVSQGQIELPALDVASVFFRPDSHPDADASFPVQRGEENGEENSAARTAEEDEQTPTAGPPEEVWSLRTLARARHAVARWYELFVVDTTRWPLSFDIRKVAILHDAQELMEISTLRFSKDAPLFIDAHIADARVGLRADSQTPGRWNLRLKNASLSRIATFFELEEHLSGTTDADIDLLLRDATLDARGDVSIRHVLLDHPKVSEMRVGPMNLRGEFSAQLPANAAHEATLDAAFSFNGIPVSFDLKARPIDDQTHFLADLSLRENTSCQSIWDAVPAGLVPEIGHHIVQFRGNMQPVLSLNYVGGVFHTFTLRSEGFPGQCALRIDSRDWHPRQLTRDDYVHHVQEGVTRDDIFVGPGTDDYVDMEDLPSYVPAVMYLSEEIAFYTNGALSLGLINRGIRHILPRKRFAYGGSTVTQQLVKNLYFTRTKTLSRKFQEAIIAWAVSEEVPKDRVLELYLNCIEFGPDLYGIVRASRHYFKKTPADLTALEAAWLASLKPSPRRGEREFQRGYSDIDNWNSRRIETLLRRLVQYGGHISDEDVEKAAPFVVYFPTSPNAGSRPANVPTPKEKPVTSQDFTDNAL